MVEIGLNRPGMGSWSGYARAIWSRRVDTRKRFAVIAADQPLETVQTSIIETLEERLS